MLKLSRLVSAGEGYLRWLLYFCQLPTSFEHSVEQDVIGVLWFPCLTPRISHFSEEPCEFKSLHAKSHLQDLGFLMNAAAAKSLQSCPTLCDPIDGSPPGSPVPGILMNGLIFYKSLIKAVFKSWACQTKVNKVSPPLFRSRQEYWSGLPFPSPGDLPDPGIEPRSPALQADPLTSEPPGKPLLTK